MHFSGMRRRERQGIGDQFETDRCELGTRWQRRRASPYPPPGPQQRRTFFPEPTSEDIWSQKVGRSDQISASRTPR